MYKYMYIVDWIERQFKLGKILPGEKLPTEKELSQQFGVSRQSVRRAIQVLEEKNLVTSIQGSGIYMSRRSESTSNTIALVLTDYKDYIFPDKINGIYKTLEDAGYLINLFFTNNQSGRENTIFRSLMEGDYTGLLLDGTQSALPRINSSLLSALTHKIPTVMMDSEYPGFQLPCVQLDDRKGGRIATEYLLQQGHRRIAYLGRSEYLQGTSRYCGYAEALLDADVQIRDQDIMWYTLQTYPNIYTGDSGKALLDLAERCSAIFCYNDMVAQDLIYFLQKNGFHIPDDVSIMGYDNMGSNPLGLQLSTVQHPKGQLGAMAANQLLRLMEDPKYDANYLFSPEIVPGETVKRI